MKRKQLNQHGKPTMLTALLLILTLLISGCTGLLLWQGKM